MDGSMYALDVGVAVILAGCMIAYNLHFRKEMLDKRVEDVFDARRYALIANIQTVIYAVIAVAGLSIGMYIYAPAHWMTMVLLTAFAVVDFVRALLRARRLRQKAARERSVSARAAAPEVLKAGIWMLVYTLLEAANLFYFA